MPNPVFFFETFCIICSFPQILTILLDYMLNLGNLPKTTVLAAILQIPCIKCHLILCYIFSKVPAICTCPSQIMWLYWQNLCWLFIVVYPTSFLRNLFFIFGQVQFFFCIKILIFCDLHVNHQFHAKVKKATSIFPSVLSATWTIPMAVTVTFKLW